MPFFLADFFPRSLPASLCRRLISPPFCAPYFHLAPMPLRSPSRCRGRLPLDRAWSRLIGLTQKSGNEHSVQSPIAKGLIIKSEAPKSDIAEPLAGEISRCYCWYNSSWINISNGIASRPVSFITSTLWTADWSREYVILWRFLPKAMNICIVL